MVNSRLLVFLALMIVSCQVAGQEDREKIQPRNKIIKAIGVEKGQTIGEIGVGSGYLTFHLAKKVGKDGKIYANEISRTHLATVKAKTERERIKNIETVLGNVEDPLFPEKNLDMIVMMLVLHHLDKPVEFMENVKKYLKKDGVLIVIERDSSIDRAHPPSFMSVKQVLEVLKETGFVLVKKDTFLSKDTIYFLKVKG